MPKLTAQNRCPLPNCPVDFHEHLELLDEFAAANKRLPRQRRNAADLVADEGHLGQFVRSLTARRRARTADLRLDAQAWDAVLHLRKVTPPFRRSHGDATPLSIEEMVSVVEAYLREYGVLPRLFGIEESVEKKAGQLLNTLRCIDRGSRKKDRRRFTSAQRADIEARLGEDWRGLFAGNSVRKVPRYKSA